MATIRAKVKKRQLQLLKPLPKSWKEGVEVELNGGPVLTDPEDIRACLAEVERLARLHDDPEDWRRIEKALEENDRLAKEWMRREMGLDS
jgi:hypothetical protein